TTGSAYQQNLIDTFAAEVAVSPVACPGLAEAINEADIATIDSAIDAALDQMDPGMETIVLGCTHYGLVAERIMAARAGAITLFDSPIPVAKQTLRRIGIDAHGVGPGQPDTGEVIATYASGRLVRLPQSLSAYPAGKRLLARESSAAPLIEI
ncbi:MAG: glutamate racemase, partial [Brevibacterium linens]